MRAPNGNLWPTAEQVLLLRAALLEGEMARQAYGEWAARTDVEDLDYGSQRMLPLLYRNLQRLGVDSPHLEKLKGVYRLTFYRNKLTFRSVVAVLDALARAGIDALVLKGVALVARYYREPGVRAMSDCDLLMRPEQTMAAVRVLEREGWKRASGVPINEGFLSVHNSWPFHHPNGAELDLHWYVFEQCCYPDADTDFWAGAVTTQLEGFPIRVPSTTDQFFHVCVHGAQWDRVPPLRWVADAMIILKRAADELDWRRMVDQAVKRRLALGMRGTLAFLRLNVGAPVPDSVMQDLQRLVPTEIELRDYRWRTSPPGRLFRLERLWLGYLRDRCLRPERPRPHLFAFPDYLRRRWGADHLWQIPIAAASLAAARFGVRSS